MIQLYHPIHISSNFFQKIYTFSAKKLYFCGVF